MWNRVRYFSRETVISLRRNLLMTLAGILTVAVSLSLFGGISLLGDWVDHGTTTWKSGARLQIYMNVEATQQQIDTVEKQLKDDTDVKAFRFCDKPCAFDDFKRLFRSDPDLVENTDAKALPTQFIVTPQTAELSATLKDRYEGVTGVNDARDAGDSLQALITATKVTRYVFTIMAFLLLAASVFLIVNTIRLATFARRREIEVMKLVGASNTFVRIPFILESLVQGLLGAVFAIGFVAGLKWGFDKYLNSPKGIFQGFYVTSHDAIVIALEIMFAGLIIGLLGSFIGLRRFLRV